MAPKKTTPLSASSVQANFYGKTLNIFFCVGYWPDQSDWKRTGLMGEKMVFTSTVSQSACLPVCLCCMCVDAFFLFFYFLRSTLETKKKLLNTDKHRVYVLFLPFSLSLSLSLSLSFYLFFFQPFSTDTSHPDSCVSISTKKCEEDYSTWKCFFWREPWLLTTVNEMKRRKLLFFIIEKGERRKVEMIKWS